MTNKKSSAIRQNVGEKASTKNVLYCYLRVSTQEQLKEGNSIEQQRDCAKGVAKLLDMDYFEMNDGGITSMTTAIRGDKIVPLTRPKFEEIKLGIESGEIKHLWVMNRTRWNRDMMEDMMTRNHYFIPNKVKMYEDESGQERLYAEPQEQLIDKIITGFGQYIRDNTRKLSISGKKHLSIADGKSGVFMGGTINYGYKNVDKKWTIEDGEAAMLKMSLRCIHKVTQ